jgi:hypothetical protein
MSKTKKEKITEIILNELPDKYFEDKNLEKIIFKMWVTGRTGKGLRLTDIGRDALEAADISHYDYSLNIQKVLGAPDKKKVNEFTIQLDKKIKCPFYLGMRESGKKKLPYIRIYDSKVAMMINLYGSIDDYLTHTGIKNA